MIKWAHLLAYITTKNPFAEPTPLLYRQSAPLLYGEIRDTLSGIEYVRRDKGTRGAAGEAPMAASTVCLRLRLVPHRLIIDDFDVPQNLREEEKAAVPRDDQQRIFPDEP